MVEEDPITEDKQRDESQTGGIGRGEYRSSDVKNRAYLTGLTFINKPVTYSEVDGDAVFEGDILLGSAEEMKENRRSVEEPGDLDSVIAAGVVIPDSRFRWPNGVVPFVVDDDLPNQQRVTDAIEHWEEHTNLRFQQRSDEPNFIEFVPGDGCSSFVGITGGSQPITLADACSTGNTIHEIGHAIGCWHEQSREDRDVYIEINWDNVHENRKHNFNQHISDGDDLGPYDYDSIMHYNATAFAIDPSKPTILSPQPIGQRSGLSDYDIRTANTMYPRKTTLGDTSEKGPVVANRNERLLLSWIGTGNHRLNFMRSSDGANFADKVTLGETSPNGPDLTLYGDRYVVAWTGTGNNQLNVMQSDDGQSWDDKVTLADTSESAPSLATFGPHLYLAWRGVGNDWLNVMRSTDGKNWTHKQILRSDTTSSGPSLVTHQGNLLLAWRGVGNDQLNVMRSHNGTSFHGKTTLPETTISKPQLHSHENRVYLCWQGVGNNFLNLIPSREGIDWHGKITSGETCIDGPALGTFDPVGDETRMLWSWTGTDSQHQLNVGLI